MEILANVLREPGCSGGIIAGDFNAISPEDDGLVNRNGLVDAWVALHGRADPDGATWGFGVERQDGLGPSRLDKVVMLGLMAKEMEVLRPGPIEVPRPGEKPFEIPWSDHCGLRCTFTIWLSDRFGLAPSTRDNCLVWLLKLDDVHRSAEHIGWCTSGIKVVRVTFEERAPRSSGAEGNGRESYQSFF